MAGEIVVIPEEERNLRGLELAEMHFPMERRAQVAQFLDIPAESPALLPYLALCASLNLSPVFGHVWLIPKKIKAIPAKDGEPGVPARTVYKPAIGRDGLLHKARETKGKSGGYKGMTYDVVCEHDTFEVERTINPDKPPMVVHRYASKPTIFAAGQAADRYRGRIIGAWACCYIDGEPPHFYYANLREHAKLRHVWDYNPNAHQRRPLFMDASGKPTWAEFDGTGIRHRPLQEFEGAWDYTSTMVLKAAQSYVLRIGLGITGVVPVDELRDPHEWSMGMDEPHHGATIDEPVFDAREFTDDAALQSRLADAIGIANELDPYSWAPAKCQMVMANRSDGELVGIAEQIERENELRQQRASAAAAEPVVDGDAVEEPEPRRADEPAPDRHEEVDQGRVDVLRARLADLRGKRHRATEEQQGEIVAELDQIESELRELLGLDPGADV